MTWTSVTGRQEDSMPTNSVLDTLPTKPTNCKYFPTHLTSENPPIDKMPMIWKLGMSKTKLSKSKDSRMI